MSSRRWSRYAQIESNDAIVSRLAQQDKVPWYSKPNLRYLYLLMFPTCLTAEMVPGIDMSIMNGLQTVPSWLEYFHYPRSALLGFMVAMYPLGFAAAVPLVPFVVDKMGRRYPIFAAGIVSVIGGIVQAFALNYRMFMAARFIIGFANVFSTVAACSLIGELSHPNERPVISSILSAIFDFGALTAAVVVLGTFAMTNNWAWRIPILVQAVPGIFQAFSIWYFPESPRWLLSRGRGDEAYAILAKYHAEGDENSDFARAEYAQIEQTLEAEQRISKAGWNELFSTPGMRKRLAIAISLALSVPWCGIGLTNTFLSPVLDTIGVHDNRTKNIISLARIAWCLANGIACAFIASRFPRRTVFLASTTSLCVVFTALTIANAEYSSTHHDVSARAVLILIFLHSSATIGFVSMIFSYLVELFPFHVRAKGLSVYQWWLRIAAFISHVMDPIGLDAAGTSDPSVHEELIHMESGGTKKCWKWYTVYCVWNAIQVVFVYFMFPETSGRTLEELNFLFESDREAFVHSEVEPLCEHREAREYNTMGRRSGC